MHSLIRILAWSIFALPTFSAFLAADPEDVESSRDYPGFPRLPGFVITDYDEDNPATFDFPVARPLPIDVDHVEMVHVEMVHVEMVHVEGHRLVIRYETGSTGRPISLIDSQHYYEKLAVAAGFRIEKTGAVGGVGETFSQVKNGREVWLYLEPGMMINVVTFVEANHVSALSPASVALSSNDPLYTMLVEKGRIILPLTFLPSKPDLDADAQPILDRVAHILKTYPNLQLQIEGHTDATIDPTEDEHLSLQRARTVQAILVAEGVAKNRLEAVGLGGSIPLVSDNTAEGRAENRRIELVLRSK